MFKKEINIIKSYPILILTLPISFILFIPIFLMSPFILIRFGLIHSDRIGHFAANTELFLCEQNIKNIKKNILDIFYFPTIPCNKQLSIMVRRKLFFLPKIIVRPFCLISRKIPFLNRHVTGRSSAGDYDIYNLYEKLPTQLTFNNKEKRKGEEFIKEINPSGRKIVCLIIRDSKYLATTSTSNKFKYHNHRDDDISRYESAVLYLIKKGFFVIRMGKFVKKRMKIKNPYFLDYATSNVKTDFLDIYLGFKCFFCISNVTGYDAIPTIFRRPILFIGSIPIGCMSTSSKLFLNSSYVHYSVTLKRALSIREIFERNLAYEFTEQGFKKKGIKLIKFTSSEIVLLVKEMLSYLNNDKKNILDNCFKKFYTNLIKIYPCKNQSFHGLINSYFSTLWLKKNRLV